MGLASGRVSRVFGPLAIARLGQALSLRQKLGTRGTAQS